MDAFISMHASRFRGLHWLLPFGLIEIRDAETKCAEQIKVEKVVLGGLPQHC